LNNQTYNGYSNYETWNVAHWLGNDEGLYNFAKGYKSYQPLRESLEVVGFWHTPDGVSLTDYRLDTSELDEVVSELS
jgi:hypothetical protein